jgi:hypothetical protein
MERITYLVSFDCGDFLVSLDEISDFLAPLLQSAFGDRLGHLRYLDDLLPANRGRKTPVHSNPREPTETEIKAISTVKVESTDDLFSRSSNRRKLTFERKEVSWKQTQRTPSAQ